MPRGRPTDYVSEFDGIALRLAMLGKTDEEIADILGVSRSTLNNWKKRHPSFLDALARGRAPADARVASSLFQAAIGYSHKEEKILLDRQGQVVRVEVTRHYPPDVRAAIKWLEVRQRGFWYAEQPREARPSPPDAADAKRYRDQLRAMDRMEELPPPDEPDDAA